MTDFEAMDSPTEMNGHAFDACSIVIPFLVVGWELLGFIG